MSDDSPRPRRCRTCEKKLRESGVKVGAVRPLSPQRREAR